MLKDDEYPLFLENLYDALPTGARFWLHRARLGESGEWIMAIAIVFAESEDDFHRYEQIYIHGMMAVQGDAAAAQQAGAVPATVVVAATTSLDNCERDGQAPSADHAASDATDQSGESFADDEAFRDIGISIAKALPEHIKLHLFGCLPQVGWGDSEVRRVRAFVLVEDDADFTLYCKVYERGVSEAARVPGVVDWYVREHRSCKATANPPLGLPSERGTPQVKTVSVRGVGRGGLRLMSRLRLRLVAALLRRELARGHSVIVTGDTASGKSVILGQLPGIQVAPDRAARERESLPLSLAWKGTGPLRIDDPQGFEHDSLRAVLETCAQGARPVAIVAQREDFVRQIFADYAAVRNAPPITWVKLEKTRRRARAASKAAPYEI
ncbi:hypothetical protein [Paraburkholderia youngii]|uniref:hypothetical protein n=1 Tax=Paraburkholderia youngii TaxID=2782701 RepID=UPI003D251E2E